MTTIWKYKHVKIEEIDIRETKRESKNQNNYACVIVKWNKIFDSMTQAMKYIDTTRIEYEPVHSMDMLKLVKVVTN